MKLLVLSNGKGEDSIATTILRALEEILREKGIHIKIDILPLIGEGETYKKANYKIIGSFPPLPSHGFGSTNFFQLLKDLKAGLLSIISKQIKILRKESKDTDLILCVGDIYPVVLSAVFTKVPIVNIASATSAYFKKYNFIEKLIFRRRCKLVISKDRYTADILKKSGIAASYFGNFMLDDPNLKPTQIDFGIDKETKVIGLAPSSREDAYDNIDIMLKIISNIENKNIACLLSFSSSLNLDTLKNIISKTNWIFGEGELLDKKGHKVKIVLENFGDVIRRSDIVLGMTGTGNEQVVGLGKPLVLLVGAGSHAGRIRINQYKKLLGEATFVASTSPNLAAGEIENLLKSQKSLEKMGEFGKGRFGDPPQTYKIAEEIFNILNASR